MQFERGEHEEEEEEDEEEDGRDSAMVGDGGKEMGDRGREVM